MCTVTLKCVFIPSVHKCACRTTVLSIFVHYIQILLNCRIECSRCAQCAHCTLWHQSAQMYLGVCALVLIEVSFFQIDLPKLPCALWAQCCSMYTRVYNILFDEHCELLVMPGICQCALKTQSALLGHRRLIFSFYLCAGPRWYRKKSGLLLLASQRHDASWICKYAGNIAYGQRSSPWKRA